MLVDDDVVVVRSDVGCLPRLFDVALHFSRLLVLIITFTSSHGGSTLTNQCLSSLSPTTTLGLTKTSEHIERLVCLISQNVLIRSHGDLRANSTYAGTEVFKSTKNLDTIDAEGMRTSA